MRRQPEHCDNFSQISKAGASARVRRSRAVGFYHRGMFEAKARFNRDAPLEAAGALSSGGAAIAEEGDWGGWKMGTGGRPMLGRTESTRTRPGGYSQLHERSQGARNRSSHRRGGTN